MVKRDGIQGALAFARQTKRNYRRAVLSRTGLCSNRAGRIEFIKSYKAFNTFIQVNEALLPAVKRYENIDNR